MPSSVTVSPSLMILPDGVLQLYPGGDGDGININNNNSSNNNEEENVSMDRILSVSSEGVMGVIVMGIKVTYCMGGSCNCQEILGTVQQMYCPSDCACVRARARVCVCVCVCVVVVGFMLLSLFNDRTNKRIATFLEY